MKILVFTIGADRYGMALRDIARVLPLPTLKQVPLAPPWAAGVLDLHGEAVPVVDLAQLAGCAPEAPCVDTRIVVVDAGARQLGLLAQHVSGIETFEAGAGSDTGLAGAPFLGRVVPTPSGLLQLVDTARLLPPEVREQLFQAALEAS
jgi:chemotaxis-related protein WspB